MAKLNCFGLVINVVKMAHKPCCAIVAQVYVMKFGHFIGGGKLLHGLAKQDG